MIFFDFDGTIVDLWPRYFAVFSELLNLESIDIAEYKEQKQLLIRDDKVAKHFGKQLPFNYFNRKAHLLEKHEYLILDKLFFSKQLINEFFSKYHAMILTKRRDNNSFEKELKLLNINVPKKVISDGTKAKWIEENYKEEKCIIIGDSIADLEAGKLINTDAYMVNYGLGTKGQFDKTGIPYCGFLTRKDVIEILKGNSNGIQRFKKTI